MTGLHKLRMELLDQGSDDVHVLDTVIQSLESLEVLDLLVLGQVRGGLVGFHGFEEHLKVVGVDDVPESFLPGFELAVNDGDKIPHLLELDQLVFAVIELLLLGPLELEKLLEHLKLFGIFFHGTGLFVVLANLFVSGIDDRRASIQDSVGKCGLEFHSVAEYFDLELTDANLHIVGLLRLQGQDGFLDGAERVVGGVFELSPRVLNGDEQVDALGHVDVNVMFLEQLDSVSKCGEALEGLLLDLGHVSEMGHDLGEELLVLVVSQVLREYLNA
jgi:hypothetical protein